jgi:peptidoglycan/LPS O-acetylase OafA/YrhL
MGVDLFFVLSGFLITSILLDERFEAFAGYIGTFYARRARRILPPYVLILSVTALLFGLHALGHWYFYFGAMNLFRCPPTLPLWSLAVEEQFYLLWPIAVFFLSRRQLIQGAIAMMALAPILRYLCTPLVSRWVIYGGLPFRMDTLAAGALIALVGLPAWRHRNALALAAAAVGLAGLLTLAHFGISTYGDTPLGNAAIYESTLLLTASLFVLVLGGFGSGLFSARLPAGLGRISYSFYLVHLTALTLAPNVFLAALAALAYSIASWFLLERPILTGRFGLDTAAPVTSPAAHGTLPSIPS